MKYTEERTFHVNCEYIKLCFNSKLKQDRERERARDFQKKLTLPCLFASKAAVKDFELFHEHISVVVLFFLFTRLVMFGCELLKEIQFRVKRELNV
jgi:hypothetical protein